MARLAAILAVLVSMSAWVLGASPASAQPRLLGAPSGQALLALAAAPSAEQPLDRNAIFEILCGGTKVRDPALAAHLWNVAGSLAARHWTPPRVTVRVVVGPR